MDAGTAEQSMLLRRGLALEYATLGWNVAGSGILIASAIATGSLALAGFGVDSLIEIVASAVVVWHLKGEANSARQRLALRIISVAFALLAAYIAVQVTLMLRSTTHPGHSTLGIVWLALTVLAMVALAAGKRDTGVRLPQPGPAHRGTGHRHRRSARRRRPGRRGAQRRGRLVVGRSCGSRRHPRLRPARGPPGMGRGGRGRPD